MGFKFAMSFSSFGVSEFSHFSLFFYRLLKKSLDLGKDLWLERCVKPQLYKTSEN